MQAIDHELKIIPNPITVNRQENCALNGDDQDVGQFGYRPELKRRFGFWSMLGLSTSILITWEGWLVVCGVSLSNGGKAGAVWSFLFVWLGNLSIVASLSELISMIPTAGGQYHWVYVLAPKKYRKFLSWITGWQMILAWQADLAAVLYLAGTIIQSLAGLNFPGYQLERWHGTLIIWAMILLTICFNTLLSRMLPMFEGGILVLHCIVFVVLMVPLIYFGDHSSARDVFTKFQTLAGYSPGTSFFVGLVASAFAFLGADGAIHMCEEVRDARTNVPKALLYSIILNGTLGLAVVLAIAFSIDDVAVALDTKTGYVFIDVFANCLHSNGFATGLTVIFEVMIIFACIAVMASASRVTWAFSRDHGLPASQWLKRVSISSQLPLNSIVITAVLSFLLSLINIGSSVAFNAIVSLVVASFFGSYSVPIAIVAYRRFGKQPMRMGPWSMGRIGLVVNIYALAFLSLTWVFSFFPAYTPVVPSTMNWSCVLWSGSLTIGVLWYIVVQRHMFTGPTVTINIMDMEEF